MTDFKHLVYGVLLIFTFLEILQQKKNKLEKFIQKLNLMRYTLIIKIKKWSKMFL